MIRIPLIMTEYLSKILAIYRSFVIKEIPTNCHDLIIIQLRQSHLGQQHTQNLNRLLDPK